MTTGISLSASYKYGLTVGTEKAKDIELTERGQRATRPTSPEEKAMALQEAALGVESLAKVYRHFDNAKLPADELFQNTLDRQFGIPREHVEECVQLILANGRFAGMIRDVGGSPYVMLAAGPIPVEAQAPASEPSRTAATTGPRPGSPALPAPPVPDTLSTVNAVFVAHGGKNKKLLDQVKQVVQFGRFTPIVAEERESTAIAVPDKIIAEMHACQAAIIIVSADEKRTDADGKETFEVNRNVPIEIGAATVLYPPEGDSPLGQESRGPV